MCGLSGKWQATASARNRAFALVLPPRGGDYYNAPMRDGQLIAQRVISPTPSRRMPAGLSGTGGRRPPYAHGLYAPHTPWLNNHREYTDLFADCRFDSCYPARASRPAFASLP